MDEPASLFAELEAARSRLAAAEGRIADLLRALDHNRVTMRRLAAMATTDVLTELGNRRLFEAVLGECFAHSALCGAPLSVVLVDVDGFKSYNDAFGHRAGDEILRIIARQLVISSRSVDVVTRFGGEEFAIVLPDADAVASLGFAEQQREAVESFAWPRRPVTASFGVATWTPAIEDVTYLMEEADRALYASKDRGRNRVTHLAVADGPAPTVSAGEPLAQRSRFARAGYHQDSAGMNDLSRHSPRGERGYADLGSGRLREQRAAER